METVKLRTTNHSSFAYTKLIAKSSKVETDFIRWTYWEGDAFAEPKYQRVASSEWRMIFLDVSTPAMPPKISVVREQNPPVKNPAPLRNFGA